MRVLKFSVVLGFLVSVTACGGSTPPAETPEAAPPAETAAEPAPAEEAEAARPLNVELLRSSFKLVVEREPKLTSIFYGHLFADYPDSKKMFEGVDLDTQGKMLATALSGVVDHLEDPEWLTKTLGELGQRHADYGVKEEHYAWVGASLLKTLAQVAGDDWTPEMAQAWGDAYAAIQKLMLAGVKS